MAVNQGITGLEPLIAGLIGLSEGVGKSILPDEQRLEAFRRNPALLAGLAPYAQRAQEEGTTEELARLLDLPGDTDFINTLAGALPPSAQEVEAERRAKAMVDAGVPEQAAATEVKTLQAQAEQGTYLRTLFGERNKTNLAELTAAAEVAAAEAQRLGSNLNSETIIRYSEYLNDPTITDRERLHAIEALQNPQMLAHRDRLAQMDLQSQLAYLRQVMEKENRGLTILEQMEVYNSYDDKVRGLIEQMREFEENGELDSAEAKAVKKTLETQFAYGQGLIEQGYMQPSPLVSVDEYRTWWGKEGLTFSWVAYGDPERMFALQWAQGRLTNEQIERGLGAAASEDPGAVSRIRNYYSEFANDLRSQGQKMPGDPKGPQGQPPGTRNPMMILPGLGPAPQRSGGR